MLYVSFNLSRFENIAFNGNGLGTELISFSGKRFIVCGVDCPHLCQYLQILRLCFIFSSNVPSI